MYGHISEPSQTLFPSKMSIVQPDGLLHREGTHQLRTKERNTYAAPSDDMHAGNLVSQEQKNNRSVWVISSIISEYDIHY
mmetsp:Transcript_5607/g.10145  ORF Transcript_5607/g.10145 Transcript_5607/m.10145 type:complete len:80 (+) Transcript_5607:264-503(+)